MTLSKSFVRSLSLIAVFVATAVASAEENLPTPRSIIFTAGEEQAAQPVILAARQYAAFWNTGEARYAKAALAGISLIALSLGTAEQGYLHCGSNGAGHLVKMVHNSIEYGIMAAYAEGFGVLKAACAGKQQGEADAETTPLRDPEHYQYEFDLTNISEVWRRGSVITSWLLDLTANALASDPKLSQFAGRVSDSGEGRWTIKAAINEDVPVPVLTTALYERFTSRGAAGFQDKLLSAMRFGFGGHLEKPVAKMS
jgi:6-phosphogluconate dehydrogenase (decarboxylating)